MKFLACDISLKTLVNYNGLGRSETQNDRPEIVKLLNEHPDCAIVCEPTSKYHLPLVETAVALGRAVYLVNPKEARNYKDSLCHRAKTDPLDARFLYEYATRNHDLLRPYQPASPELVELRRLLGERHVAVESRTALAQAFGKNPSPAHLKALEALTDLIRELEKRLEAIARRYDSYKTVRAIPGVGPISGYALVYVLESKAFDSPDALVAFLGLDVRVRLSGKYKGQGKLTKRGDPLLRCLLCIAGRGLLNSRFGKKKNVELIAKNRYFAERISIAARKVLRTAFTLFKEKRTFNHEKWTWAL
jgi:transposase